jgi:RHS repeat-associated protein
MPRSHLKWCYDAFGKPTITDWSGNVRATSAYGNRFMFTGREWFPELGIYDYRNRAYQPELGRFLQADAKGFDAGDFNLFRYCADDPVDKSDPTGLFGVTDSGAPVGHDGTGGAYGQGSTDQSSEQPRIVREFTCDVEITGSHIPLHIKYTESGNWNDRRIDDHYKAGLEQTTGDAGQTRVTGSAFQRGRNIDIDLRVDWFVDTKYRGTDVVKRELYDHVRDTRMFSRAFTHSLDAPRLSLERLNNFTRAVHSFDISQKIEYDWGQNAPHPITTHPAVPTVLPEYDDTH